MKVSRHLNNSLGGKVEVPGLQSDTIEKRRLFHVYYG